MGMVFGKETVAEPSFEVLFERSTAKLPYQLRQYGERFIARADYEGNNENTPFRTLARYIGVFGNPENEGSEKIAMTAPVVMQQDNDKSHKNEGTSIAMTAPVMMYDNKENKRTMAFVLPAEYDAMEKIPMPTNSRVKIEQIPPQTGAVHRFSGPIDEEKSKEIALKLAYQLREDGLSELTDEDVLRDFQFWGYNPPFTIPMFRRNEVWIGLDDKQAERVLKHLCTESMN